MDINYRTVREDPQARELAAKIMAEMGLGGTPESYDGETAYDVRVAAIRKLEGALRAHGNEVCKPDKEIIKTVLQTARVIERDRSRLRLTYAVAEVAIYGHIWMHRVRSRTFDVAMAKAGITHHIRELIDDEMLRKSRCGFESDGGCGGCGGDCGGGCGGCGGHP